MTRYDALRTIRPFVEDDDLVITSLGGLMDEWHTLRPSDGNLPLHILGVISPLALGLAVARPNRRIFCFDTDGSFFLNPGTLCTLGREKPENLMVVVFDNRCYECIGGYPTPSAGGTDIAAMARGAGIEHAVKVDSVDALEDVMRSRLNTGGLAYVVCAIDRGTEHIPQDQRIPYDGFELKYKFLRHVERLEGIVIKPPEMRYHFPGENAT